MIIKTVSVIIPIRNEEGFISRSLEAILVQDRPTEQLEVLIADGMSTDDTRQIIGQIISRHPEVDIRLLDNPSRLVPTGINIALQQAKGDIIIRVDGHTVVAPDYVRQCVIALQKSGADNVGGRMNAIGSNSFGKTVALATSSPFGIGNGRFHYSEKEEWADTVYMGAWPRRVFDKIGLFDEELVRDQDDEFNYRLRSAGGKILLCPKIKSEYTVRSSPFSLWRQYFQYGYWKVRVLQKHPRQMSLRQFVPPAFVASLFVSLLLPLLIILHGRDYAIFKYSAFFIPACYLIMNLFASVITAARKSWNFLFLLPIIFTILHIAYGLGFLIGLVKFANRWEDRNGKVPVWGSA